MRSRSLSAALVLLAVAAAAVALWQSPRTARAEAATAHSPATAAAEIEFNRDIRPILSNHCFQCHGPDAEHRESGLRFDLEDIAKSELESGLRAIVAGDAAGSELVARVHSDDEFVVMPPPETHKPLSDDQKALLEAWIAAGAPYESHWSLTPLERPAVPQPPAGVRVANPIDAFVTARAAAAGSPVADAPQSPRADRRTLLRRVCFDLTGLPPTPQQLAAFEADDSPDAYEHAVDDLLENVAYGEHMARYWLDLVRYADTHGMHFDNYREMWPYRDWVIEAFNTNKPLDDFYTEQLAGDLLTPNPDEADFDTADRARLIASGFNRLNVTTNEGGSIYDEVFTRNVVDRTEAFGTVFLGLTTGCAVCHDHKFDPLSQQEFYELSAFFNSLDGRAMDQNVKDHAPSLRVPTEEQLARLQQFDEQADAVRESVLREMPAVDEAMERWIARVSQSQPASPRAPEFEPVAIETADSTGNVETYIRDGNFVGILGDNPETADYTIEGTLPAGRFRTLRLEVLPVANDRVGRSPNGNAVISEIELFVADRETDDSNVADKASEPVFRPVSLVEATADHQQDDKGFAAANVIDGKVDRNRGWALAGHQKTGGRTLWVATAAGDEFGRDQTSDPASDKSDADAEGGTVPFRFVIKQQSKYGKHTIGQFKLSVSEGTATPEAPVELGPWHVAGPFDVEARNAGVYRDFIGENAGGDDFDAARTVNYKGRQVGWQSPEDAFGFGIDDGPVIELPRHPEQVSVYVFHREIVSPIEQTVDVFLNLADTYRIYLNGKNIGESKGAAPIAAYRTSIPLQLRAGRNHLYFRQVSDLTNPPAVQFALASPLTAPTGRLREAMNRPPSERSADDTTELRRLYRLAISRDPEVTAIRSQIADLAAEKEAFDKTVATTLIWKELKTPRQAHVLVRGEYDQKGDPVSRDVPDALPPFPDDAPRDRLGLARWLLQPGHPLTARVAANRFWQQVFGSGLVRTSEDFGGQGEPPTHPQLLDWLAAELESDWNVKRLMKLIVMSETYRQRSAVSPERRALDPANRFLTRGPRFRLDAESLRDQALAVSGLLSRKVGGPSVKPPQPSGLWEAVAFVGSNTGKFAASEGDEVYRRSVYIFWKRTATAPMMATLDAPNRESCTARRERTNTPLQALLLMNEQLYLESARALARSLLEMPSPADDTQKNDTAEDNTGKNAGGKNTANAADLARIREAFTRTTGRVPTEAETAELLGLLTDVRGVLRADPEAALQLLGDPAAELVDSPEQAAWTILANTLLNLDEVVTKR